MGGKKYYFEESKKNPKNISIDVSNGGVSAKIGANLSSRIPIQMKDEMGNVVKGFFTENEFIDAKQSFETRIKDTVNDPDNQVFRPIYEAFKNKSNYTNTLKSIYRNLPGKRPAGGLPTALGKHLKVDRDVRKNFREFLESDLHLPKDQIKLIMNPKANIALGDFMYQLSNLAINAEALEDTHKTLHAMDAGENINRRNNAMSDYAELIGENDLMAKSVPATVINGDNVSHGSFMLNADGLTKEQLNVKSEGFIDYSRAGYAEAKELVMTGNAIKQLSKTQVLDFLCANFDRHPGNLIYQVDTSEPNKVKINDFKLIDNDASLGDLAYEGDGALGYMSRLGDIKIMDAEMAQKILNINDNDVEDLVRLVGTKAKSVKGAIDRLHALQGNIKNGRIQLITDEKEWEKYTKPDRYDTLCYADEDTNAFNVFDNVRFVYDFYNRNRSKQLRAYQSELNQLRKMGNAAPKAPEKKDPGFAELKIISEDGTLLDHVGRLQEFHKELSNMGGLTRTPGARNLYEKLQDSMNLMTQLSEKYAKSKEASILGKQLSPMERNSVAMSLKDIITASDEYIKLNSKPLKDEVGEAARQNRINFAKNVIAYTKHSREAVLEDSMEAEMKLASKMAADINKEYGGVRAIRTTDQNIDKLSKTLSSVDSMFVKSSPQFKKMVETFKELKKLPKNATAQQRKEKMDELAQLSEKYLNYKIPNGNKANLSDYALNRVRFAEKMKEFAEVNSENIVRDAEKKVDLVSLKKFTDNCTNLIEAIKTASNGDEKTAALDAIKSNKDNFVKGYRDMLTISEKYPDDPKLQVICEKFANKGVIQEYIYAYNSGLRAEGKEVGNNEMQNIGLNEKDMARKQQLDLRAKFADKKVPDANSVKLEVPVNVK